MALCPGAVTLATISSSVQKSQLPRPTQKLYTSRAKDPSVLGQHRMVTLEKAEDPHITYTKPI